MNENDSATEPNLHDVPSARQLVESVREWMERDLLASTSGRVQFHTRVAINVLAMVERELEVGAEQSEQHRERLASLGFSDDLELAAAIRRGDFDHDLGRVIDVVRADVEAKLSVANPGYAIPGRPVVGLVADEDSARGPSRG